MRRRMSTQRTTAPVCCGTMRMMVLAGAARGAKGDVASNMGAACRAAALVWKPARAGRGAGAAVGVAAPRRPHASVSQQCFAWKCCRCVQQRAARARTCCQRATCGSGGLPASPHHHRALCGHHQLQRTAGEPWGGSAQRHPGEKSHTLCAQPRPAPLAGARKPRAGRDCTKAAGKRSAATMRRQGLAGGGGGGRSVCVWGVRAQQLHHLRHRNRASVAAWSCAPSDGRKRLSAARDNGEARCRTREGGRTNASGKREQCE